jgi:predicted Co/Zn/Cd cation transporter (cation efflux family)
MRSGNEPMTARSPLRLRLALAIFGLLASVAAAIGFGLTGQVGLAVLFAVIAVIACLNIIAVVVRIRQGPRFQPGRDVPPR